MALFWLLQFSCSAHAAHIVYSAVPVRHLRRNGSAELFDTHFHAWPATLHRNILFLFFPWAACSIKVAWTCQDRSVCIRVHIDGNRKISKCAGGCPCAAVHKCGARCSSIPVSRCAVLQPPAARTARRAPGTLVLPLPQAVPAMLRGRGGVSAVGDTRGHCLSSVAASFWDSEQN